MFLVSVVTVDINSRFQNTPLYLEWAPDETFKTPGVKSERKEPIKPITVAEADALKDAEPEANSTLFVKNLNFDTTDETLKNFFAPCGVVHSAAVSKKRDIKRPGNWN